MLTVTLKPDVAEQVRQLAEGAHIDAEAIVDEALRTYLAQAWKEKLEAETQAFQQQHAALLKQYRGEYVAMYKGQVIDHDPDPRALHLRVFGKLAHTPVLLKQVTDQPEREVVIRSPRFERLAK
jgi:predicted transcriptional regulator